MSSPKLHLVSDFNIEVLERLLVHGEPSIEASHAPFGQVVQTLSAQPPRGTTTAVVWTRAEGVLPSFRRALDFEAVDQAAVLAEVDEFMAHVSRYAAATGSLYFVSWSLPPGCRGYGMLDLQPGLGLAHLLMRMNLRVAEHLAKQQGAVLFDGDRWQKAAGVRATSPKLWYAAKVPYANAVFEEAAQDLRAALAGQTGKARRIVVLDLDGTLWGGIVGEVGPTGVTLGGHDADGEAFVDFQRALKALIHRGVQLAVVSKNDEAVALSVFDDHPEMVLKKTDLSAYRINLLDKGENLASLLDEINLGAASAVFIDDSPTERARVREALPQVLVPEWPTDPSQYRRALEALRCFDQPSFTREDRTRTAMYVQERARRALRPESSVEDWLKSLQMSVTVAPLSAQDLVRSAQLLNKTNQLNLRTRRMPEAQLLAWHEAPGQWLGTFSVRDRIGDSGLVGLLGLTVEGREAHCADFLLSCRVMGRRVEETMVHVAVEKARALGAKRLVFEYLPTERNGPCLAFFRASGLEAETEHRFVWDLAKPYACPAVVTLVEAP